MNQMTMKLAEAGVPLPPQNKRVWQCVKDHPGTNGARIAQMLNLGQSAVTSLLTDMIRRDMVRRTAEVRKVSGPRNSITKRNVWTYYAIGNEFELLPKKTHMPPPKHKEAKQATAVSAPVAPVNTVTVPTVSEAEAFVEKMTIAEARALWAVLNRMFGDKK